MKIFEVPGKLLVTWNSEVKAIIDTWTNYTITTEEFRKAVLIEGVNFAKENKGQAWIVDSSEAKGLFTKEQLALINDEIFPTFSKIGIKYFITIKPSSSIFTINTFKQYSALTGPNNLKLIDVASIEQAILWLKSQA